MATIRRSSRLCLEIQRPKQVMNTNEENKEKEEVLTPQQELFCRYFTQNDVLMGNATLAYAEAFDFNLDEQSKDDAQYLTTTGERYAEWELRDEPSNSPKHLTRCKLVQSSSYDNMFHNVASYASKLRKRDYIQKRCRQLLNEMMSDDFIDSRLIQIIRKGDDGDAIRAINEYNKIKGRIIDKKDVTSGGKPITVVFDSAFNKNGAPQQTETDSSKL